MTAEPTLSDKQLADNVRAAADALAASMEAAISQGLTCSAAFLCDNTAPADGRRVYYSVSVQRSKNL